jgi:hypothetical protein
VGAGLAWQGARLSRARAAAVAARAEAEKAGRLEADRRAAAVPSAAELEHLRAQPAALAAARAELQRLTALEAAGAKDDAPAGAERLAVGQVVATADCRDAGLGTPRATLETVLWAAVGGDVAALARVLTFEPAARHDAEALLAQAPATLRAQCRTPEELVAFFTVRDVPPGSVEMREWWEGEGSVQTGRLALTGADGLARDIQLVFVRELDTWKLVVRAGVVEKYAPLVAGR